MRSRQEKLYHLGIRGKISKSTLADANEKQDWRIYADFCGICLSLFPWASFRKSKAAVKMHTLIDLRGNIPSFMEITDGKVHDVLTPEPSSFYIMDRGTWILNVSVFWHKRLPFSVSSAWLTTTRCSSKGQQNTNVFQDENIIFKVISERLPYG